MANLAIPLLRHERPQRCAQSEEPNRRLWCRRYDRCLDYAAALNWDSFECSACSIDDQITERERLYDLTQKRRAFHVGEYDE